MLRNSCTILFLLINFLPPYSAVAQNINQTKAFAEEAFNRGDYSNALQAFQRVAFFQESQERAVLYYKIATCYSQTNKLDLANSYYDRSFFLAEDSLVREIIFEKLKILLRQGKFNNALLEIFSVEQALEGENAKRLHFFEGLCYYGLDDFNAAYVAFDNALTPKDSIAKKQLKTLLIDNKKLARPNPNKAQNLSYILPGLGQFYAGDVKNGFNSLLLSATFIGVAINVGYRYSFIDAAISVIPWFQRYYLGGADKAKIIAEQKLSENKVEVYIKVVSVFRSALAAPHQ